MIMSCKTKKAKDNIEKNGGVTCLQQLDSSPVLWKEVVDAYKKVRQFRNFEYVSIYEVFDVIKERYNISHSEFGNLLNKYFSSWLKDRKSIALEVDGTPSQIMANQRRKRENTIMVGNTRIMIISLREKN